MTENEVNFVAQFLCGKQALEVVGGKAPPKDIVPEDQQDSSSKNLQQEVLDRLNGKEYIYDDDISPHCNELFKKTGNSVELSYVFKMVKPFLVGKVFYTPVNTVTEQLIKEANKTFDHVGMILRVISQLNASRDQIFQNLSDFFEDPNNSNNTKTKLIMDVISQSSGNGTLNFANDPFYSNNPKPGEDNWQQLFNSTFDFIEQINNYTQCYMVDKFQGIESESRMEAKAKDLIYANKIWAGFVFEGIEDKAKTVDKSM